MPLSKLTLLAYRDIGRNRRRTFFSIVAVALGMMLMITMNGWIAGIWDDMLENSIRLNTGHVKVYAESYEPEKLSLKWEDLLSDPQAITANARSMPEVEIASPVLRASAIVNTIDDSVGVQLQGIDPSSALTDFVREGIIAGDYLSLDSNGILVGKKLADELNLSVGRDVAIDLIDASGVPQEAVFTIQGIFLTDVSTYDSNTVFMPLARAQSFTGVDDRASDITILLYNGDDADSVAAALAQPGLVTKTADQMNQVVIDAFNLGSRFYVIMYIIVMVVVAVVVANTLLMSVFERVREIGVLASIGMKSRQILTMMMVEASLLGLIGVLVGALLGLGLVSYLAIYGVNIGNMTSSVEGVAMSSVMYAAIVPTSFLVFGLWTMGVILLVSLYPAWYASRLEPVEALHNL